MKAAIICILLILQARTAKLDDAKDDILAFINGLLKGFAQNGEKDFGEIITCIEEIITPATYEKIKEDILGAIELLKHIDALHWETILKALEQLFNKVYDIINIINPCIKSVKEIESIISLLSNLNPLALLAKVGKNLIFHGGKLLNDLIELYNSGKKGNWEKMGFSLADFIYNLLLKSPAPAQLQDGCDSNGCLIFKGVLEGIASQGYDVSGLINCIGNVGNFESDINEMITELQEIMSKLKLRDIFKVIHALKYVFNDLKDLFDIIENCGIALDDNIKNIIDVFKSTDIAKLVEKFALNLIKHFGTVFQDITSAIDNYKAGNFETCGQNIGSALYTVFLE